MAQGFVMIQPISMWIHRVGNMGGLDEGKRREG
jgi:hypothetical protein